MTFADLKPGDVVIYHPGGYHTDADTKVVMKITATQIVLRSWNSPLRCRKTDGRVMGDSGGWGGLAYIEIATPDALDKIRRRKLASELAGTQAARWQTMPTDRLAAICEELAVATKKARDEQTTDD